MLIIAVGFLALWVLVTGRLSQLQGAWNVLTGTATVATPSNPFGAITNLLGGGTGTGIGTGGQTGTTAPLPIPTFPTTDQGGGGNVLGQLLGSLGL